MRVLFGMILGALLTVGAVHPSRLGDVVASHLRMMGREPLMGCARPL